MNVGRVRRRTSARASPGWPPGRPRLLVIDAWLANAGDGAIALATERRLRQLSPAAAILHAAYQGAEVGAHYPELDLVPSLAELLGITPLDRASSGWTPETARELVAQADGLLSQGGGFLMEHYQPVARLHAYDLVVRMGLPLAFCAQSIGRWTQRLAREMLARALRWAVAVSVRDSVSALNVLDLCSPLGGVQVTADEAFSLFPTPPPQATGRGLGLVLTSHRQVSEAGRVIRRPEPVAAGAKIVAAASAALGAERVVLFSPTQGLAAAGLEDDRLLAQQVVDSLPAEVARSIETVDGYLPPTACMELISGLRGLVSMRMHPAIFGLSAGVPSLHIDAGFKATAQFPELGLGFALSTGRQPATKLRRAIAALVDPGAERGEALWLRLAGARVRADANERVYRALIAAAEAHASAMGG